MAHNLCISVHLLTCPSSSDHILLTRRHLTKAKVLVEQLNQLYLAWEQYKGYCIIEGASWTIFTIVTSFLGGRGGISTNYWSENRSCTVWFGKCSIKQSMSSMYTSVRSEGNITMKNIVWLRHGFIYLLNGYKFRQQLQLVQFQRPALVNYPTRRMVLNTHIRAFHGHI